MAKLKSILRAVTGIDLAAMDGEIERIEAEVGKLKVTREALGRLKATLGNGADPTVLQGTILERATAFLRDGKEATAAEIAEGIGAERPTVYTALRKHEELFRQKENRWRLK